MHKLLILLLSLVILVSCSNSSKDDPCSSAENIDDAVCVTDPGTVETGSVSLDLTFKDSYFYNSLEKDWKTISKDNLAGGIFGEVVPAYSSFLNMTKDQAVDTILLALNQKQNPESYNESDFSKIPYIELKYEKGFKFVYNYVKKDLEGNPVSSVTGEMVVRNDRVFLPLINDMFGGQYYAQNDVIGKRFLHSVSISLQSEDNQRSSPKIVEFESVLQTPVTDFYVDYSSSMNNFTLNNRFDYYYSLTDGVPNQDFHFFTLKEDDEPEAVPVDIRILFKERPVLKIEQELFYEVPFNIDTLKATKKIDSIVRGENFYTKSSILTSDDHFQMKVRMNKQIQTLSDGREFVINALPAYTPWFIEFYYDFQPNENYSTTSGTPLLHPFKPICQEITNSSFKPLEIKQENVIAKQNEGFLSICHPDLGTKIFLSKSELATTNLDLTDSFYDFFNYEPYNENVQLPEGSTLVNSKVVDAGNFHGLRSVKFKLEGCMRVYVKTPTSTSWELKSKTSNACKDEGEENSEGWVYFNAEKTFTINDYIDNYEGVPGLKSLIQSFGNKPVRKTPHFKFNGLVNEVEHIY